MRRIGKGKQQIKGQRVARQSQGRNINKLEKTTMFIKEYPGLKVFYVEFVRRAFSAGSHVGLYIAFLYAYKPYLDQKGVLYL